MHHDLPASDDLPWTISYVIRKRNQIDGFAELPKEKRPPEDMIWYGAPEEIEHWFDRVFKTKDNKRPDQVYIQLDDDEIE